MLKEFFKKHSTSTIIAVVIVALLASIISHAIKKPNATVAYDSKKIVQLIAVKDYQQNSGQVIASGTVQSLQQADLRAQATGQVARIAVTIGQQVGQGQLLATLQNNDTAAQVQQAEAALQAAQANYNLLIAGAKTQDIQLSQSQLASAQQTLADVTAQQGTAVASALQNYLNSGLAAYGASSNSSTATATVSGTYTGTQQGSYKIVVSQTGSGYNFTVSGLETGDYPMTRGTPQPIGKKGLFVTFSTTGTFGFNDSWTIPIPNTQSATYASAQGAYNAAVSGSQSAINAAQNAVTQAQQALQLKSAPPTQNQIDAAQALVNQASANVSAARAQLAKTVFVAPFSGTISAVNVKYGDLVSNGQTVFSIVNKGGLQVKVFVSAADLAAIQSNAAVQIGDAAVKGTVTNFSPSVDPTSKTAEVDIAIADPANSGLTVGQNVAVKISSQPTSGVSANTFLLPIQSVKISPNGNAFVYTVDKNNKVAEVPVTVGKVNGEKAEVLSGVSPDNNIISSSYDVVAGESVTVQ